MLVGATLAATFVALMATATVEEFAHEWLGMAAFALFAAHMILHRNWWAHLPKGRYSASRAVAAVVNLGLLLCTIGQVASSLVLSQYAFGWLPAFDGSWWARIVHLVCSYWGFVLAFAHMGLSMRSLGKTASRLGGAKAGVWIARLAGAAVACAGVWSFFDLDMATYLTLRSEFVFAAAEASRLVVGIEYAAVGAAIAWAAHYASRALRALSRGRVATRLGGEAFPPAIVDAANAYLAAHGAQETALEVTGASFDELVGLVGSGSPVLVWTTIYGLEPEFSGAEMEGYRWYLNEHCVVLYGMEGGEALVSDPLEGLVRRDAAEFRRLYEACGSMAAVL